MVFGKLQSAGDVVVMDVGLGDMRDPHTRVGDGLVYPVGVPLGVNDHADFAVVEQINAVAQLGRFDRDYFHAGFLLDGGHLIATLPLGPPWRYP